MVPPPPTIPILGITGSLPITSVSSDGNEVTVQILRRFQNVVVLFLHQSSHLTQLHCLAVLPLLLHPTNQPHILF